VSMLQSRSVLDRSTARVVLSAGRMQRYATISDTQSLTYVDFPQGRIAHDMGCGSVDGTYLARADSTGFTNVNRWLRSLARQPDLDLDITPAAA